MKYLFWCAFVLAPDALERCLLIEGEKMIQSVDALSSCDCLLSDGYQYWCCPEYMETKK